MSSEWVLTKSDFGHRKLYHFHDNYYSECFLIKIKQSQSYNYHCLLCKNIVPSYIKFQIDLSDIIFTKYKVKKRKLNKLKGFIFNKNLINTKAILMYYDDYFYYYVPNRLSEKVYTEINELFRKYVSERW